MGISGMPDVYYLDEPRVNQRMQMIHQGQVQEVVETVSSTDNPADQEGIDAIYSFLDRNRGAADESIEEFTRTVQSTPIGQFIAFHGVIDKQKDDLTNVSEVDEDVRDSLKEKDYIKIKGKIERPPWTELYDRVNQYGIDIKDLGSDENDLPEKSEENLFEELKDSARYYQISINGRCNGDFIFKMWDENIQNIARDFPDRIKEYTVFAQIDHIYEKGQERNFFDFLDDSTTTKDRGKRTENRLKMKKLANDLGAETSDLYISYPDVVVTPIAIYG